MLAEADHRWAVVRRTDRYVWSRCLDCPGDIQMRTRRTDMGSRQESDKSTSTCSRCGNYNCICVRHHKDA